MLTEFIFHVKKGKQQPDKIVVTIYLTKEIAGR